MAKILVLFRCSGSTIYRPSIMRIVMIKNRYLGFITSDSSFFVEENLPGRRWRRSTSTWSFATISVHPTWRMVVCTTNLTEIVWLFIKTKKTGHGQGLWLNESSVFCFPIFHVEAVEGRTNLCDIEQKFDLPITHLGDRSVVDIFLHAKGIEKSNLFFFGLQPYGSLLVQDMDHMDIFRVCCQKKLSLSFFASLFPRDRNDVETSMSWFFIWILHALQKRSSSMCQ